MTIYMPDDLADQVKAHADLNVSAVCQDALRAELGRRQVFSKLDEKMERVVVHLEDSGDVSFTGKEIFRSDDQATTAYVTRRHQIAIYSDPNEKLWVFGSFAELAADRAWEQDAALLSAVADAVGVRHITELDI